MESSHTSPLLFLSLALSLAFFFSAATEAAPLNVTAILDKAGQYTMLIRLFKSTQVEIQLINQLNNSQNTATLFAPTDNAFDNLPAGFLNGLSQELQVKLVNFHILPKLLGWDDFQTISNPVSTQASGPNGPYGLNLTYIANQQVNVSAGSVVTTFTNALNLTKPVAIYQVDKVLLPADKFTEKLAADAPAPATGNGTAASGGTPVKGSGNSSSGAGSGRGGWSLKGMSLMVLMGLVCLGLVI